MRIHLDPKARKGIDLGRFTAQCSLFHDEFRLCGYWYGDSPMLLVGEYP